MSEENQFLTLIERVRAGDPEAVAELFDRYEPHVRRVARNRMRDKRMRRLVDSADIRQSVMRSFFMRAALGQFEIESPDDLLKLLGRMVKNKVIDKGRRLTSEKAGGGQAHGPIDTLPVAGTEPSPSEVVRMEELVALAEKMFSDEERQMKELRSEGNTWAAIAEEMGGTAEGRRKQYERAVDRIAEELGLNEE